jgi:hypothetical protein
MQSYAHCERTPLSAGGLLNARLQFCFSSCSVVSQVLVVDPNPVRAEITCSCVGRMGMVCCVEKNPTEALQVRRRAAFK